LFGDHAGHHSVVTAGDGSAGVMRRKLVPSVLTMKMS
jgi:hypothetical protein